MQRNHICWLLCALGLSIVSILSVSISLGTQQSSSESIDDLPVIQVAPLDYDRLQYRCRDGHWKLVNDCVEKPRV